jgi:hypothetical protein
MSDTIRTAIGLTVVLAGVVLLIVGLRYIDPPDWEGNRRIVEAADAVRAADVKRCRDAGGFPVFSGWTGRMVKCEAFPAGTQDGTRQK